MKIKEDSRFQRRKIEDDTKSCPAGGEDGKANVVYLLLSPSVFFYLRRKWNFRNLSKLIVKATVFVLNVHFPTQKWAKMLWRTLSEVISLPVISAR